MTTAPSRAFGAAASVKPLRAEEIAGPSSSDAAEQQKGDANDHSGDGGNGPESDLFDGYGGEAGSTPPPSVQGLLPVGVEGVSDSSSDSSEMDSESTVSSSSGDSSEMDSESVVSSSSRDCDEMDPCEFLPCVFQITHTIIPIVHIHVHSLSHMYDKVVGGTRGTVCESVHLYGSEQNCIGIQGGGRGGGGSGGEAG